MTHPATCQACQRVRDCVSIDGVMLCGECAGSESDVFGWRMMIVLARKYNVWLKRADDGAEREDG